MLALMRAGAPRDHLRFDLVLFLEHIIVRENLSEKSQIQKQMIRDEDLAVFNLFWHFFGLPAVSGGYLDLLLSESEANTRRVKDILRKTPILPVRKLHRGFGDIRKMVILKSPDRRSLTISASSPLFFCTVFCLYSRRRHRAC